MPPPPPKSPLISPRAAKRASTPRSFTPMAFTPAPPTRAMPTPSSVATRRPASESLRVAMRWARLRSPRSRSALRTASASRGVSIPAMQRESTLNSTPGRCADPRSESMAVRIRRFVAARPIPCGLLPVVRSQPRRCPSAVASTTSVFEFPPSIPTISWSAAFGRIGQRFGRPGIPGTSSWSN